MEKRKQMITWLMVAELCFWLLPQLGRAVFFYVQKHSLSIWQTGLCDGGSVVLGVVCLVVAGLIGMQTARERIWKDILHFLQGMLPVALVYLCITRGLQWLEEPLLRLFGKHVLLAVLLIILLVLALTVLQSVFLCRWFGRCTVKKFRLFGLVAVTLLMNMVPELVFLAGRYFPLEVKIHTFSGILIYMIIAAVRTLLWIPTLKLLQEAEKTQEQDAPAGQIKLIVSAAGIVLFLVLGMIRATQFNAVKLISGQVSQKWAESTVEMVQGDYEGALEKMKEARLVKDAWLAVAGAEGAENVSTLAGRNPNYAMLQYLAGCYERDNYYLENYLKTAEMEPEFAIALLDKYHGQDNLNAKQLAYQEELVRLCVQTGTYRSSWLRPADLEGKQEKLEMELKQYEKFDRYVQLMEQVVVVLRANEVSEDAMRTCLDLAEANQSEWELQYLAALYGSECLYDGAGHYGRTIAAAERFAKLYRSQHKLTPEDERAILMRTANMILACYGYSEAIPYLEEAAQIRADEDAFALTLQCYEALGRYDDCFAFCDRWLADDPEHLTARYYAAICALKTGRSDEVIEHAMALAEYVKKNCTAENSESDVLLYSIIQYMAISDGSGTQYKYQMYKALTEEQRAIIDTDSFFADYLDATYQCFHGRKDQLEDALAKIRNVLAVNDKLSQAWYVQGAILYDMERFDEAAKAQRKSVDLMPQSATGWYALANTYNDMGEYDLAYEACQRAIALLPKMDHGTDWYGVSIHCEWLLDRIEASRNQ